MEWIVGSLPVVALEYPGFESSSVSTGKFSASLSSIQESAKWAQQQSLQAAYDAPYLQLDDSSNQQLLASLQITLPAAHTTSRSTPSVAAEIGRSSNAASVDFGASLAASLATRRASQW